MDIQSPSRLEILAEIAECWAKNRHSSTLALFIRSFNDWVLQAYEYQRHDVEALMAGGQQRAIENALRRTLVSASPRLAAPQRELLATDVALFSRLDRSGAPSRGLTAQPLLDWRVVTLLVRAKTSSGRADLTLRDLAGSLHVTEHHLGQLFHRQVEANFRRYLWDVRLTTAAALLANSCLPLKEISARLGYSAISNFSSEFRGAFDQTPARYRHTLLALSASAIESPPPYSTQR